MYSVHCTPIVIFFNKLKNVEHINFILLNQLMVANLSMKFQYIRKL